MTLSASILYFDPDEFHKFLSNPNSADEKREMITLFNQQITEYLGDLEKAMVANNHQAWRDSAHKLKGMCAFVGAHPLRDLSQYAQHNNECPQDEKEKHYNVMCHTAKETLKACYDYLDGMA